MITSDDILGKDVIDLDRKIIGVVEKVLINPKSLDFVGIEVDKGFLKKGLSIGKSYISEITEHAVFLNIKVVYEIKGMIVFDKFGKEVGKVADIELWGQKNKLKKIYVKCGVMKKQFEVPVEMIETIGANVILNESKENLLRNK